MKARRSKPATLTARPSARGVQRASQNAAFKRPVIATGPARSSVPPIAKRPGLANVAGAFGGAGKAISKSVGDVLGAPAQFVASQNSKATGPSSIRRADGSRGALKGILKK